MDHLLDRGGVSALSETVCKSACAVPTRSNASLVRASSTSAFAARAVNASICASRGSFPGRPRTSSPEAGSRERRQSIRCEGTSPHGAGSRPAGPGGARRTRPRSRPCTPVGTCVAWTVSSRAHAPSSAGGRSAIVIVIELNHSRPYRGKEITEPVSSDPDAQGRHEPDGQRHFFVSGTRQHRQWPRAKTHESAYSGSTELGPGSALRFGHAFGSDHWARLRRLQGLSHACHWGPLLLRHALRVGVVNRAVTDMGASSRIISKGATTGTRTLWSVSLGLAATVGTAAILTQVNSSWVSVALALILVALAPSAPRLDRRIAINLSLTFGLLPAALWVPSILGARTAALAALSIATGGAVVAAVARPRSVVPVIRRRDGVIALGGMLAGLVALPLSSPGSPQGALAALSTGIDNSYHYAMFLERRLMTASSSLVAANADGSGFAFDDYPQWFHRLITVLAQIGFGDPGTAPVELVRFAQLEWLVFVALTFLVTAAFVQALPDRVTPILLVPALAVVFSLMLGVPGALNLIQGHLSFLVAACAPLVMFLLTYGQRHPGPGLFAILGGLVLVTAAWMLLLPLAAAAVLPPLIAVWRRQTAVVKWCTFGGFGLLCIATVPLFVLGPLTHGAFAALLHDGTVPRVGLPTMLIVLIGSLALVVGLSVRDESHSLVGHIVIALASTLVLVVLGCYMLSSAGQLTYYFWKLALGSLIVSAVVAAHATVLVLADRQPTREPLQLRLLHSVAVVLVAAMGLGSTLQQFAAPSASWSVLAPVSLGARKTSGEAGDVDLILKLAASMTPHDAVRTRLLATRPDDMNAAHASEWFHALSHSATRRAVRLDDGVYELALDPRNIPLGVELAMSTLSKVDGRVLVTDAGLYQAILDAASPTQQSRVSLVS